MYLPPHQRKVLLGFPIPMQHNILRYLATDSRDRFAKLLGLQVVEGMEGVDLLIPSPFLRR